MDEFVEESVLSIVGGPDGEVAAPGDAALGGFPQKARVIVFGKFIEADVAAINGHGLRMSGEGDDAGAVVEFDDAHFNFFGEAGGFAAFIEAFDFQIFFAVRDDAAGEIEDVGEFAAEAHVFEGAGIIFGGEEIIAVFEMETFADVFEGVGESPADADGFFGEDDGLLAAGVEGVFDGDPVELVGGEKSR